MIFLNPLFLWGLPLVGLPLVLHLWGRRRLPAAPFSNVDVLRETLRERLLPVQLRRWVLLIVRTLLAAMIVFALARPVFHGAMGATGRRGVVLLDASYSMRTAQFGRSAFDRARDLARILLESRRDADAWGLVVFSDRVERSFPVTKDVRPLLSILQSLEPSYRPTRYSVGLDQARSMLGNGGTVVLLSDMAAHGGPIQVNDKTVCVAAVSVADPLPNGAVTGVDEVSPGFPVRVRTRRWGALPNQTWSLSQKGRISARGVVAWDGESGVTTVPSVKGHSEFVLANDSLPTDDRFYYAPPESQSGTVLVINGAPSLSPVGDETYYVRPVLNRLPTDTVTVGNSSPDSLLSMLQGRENQSPYSIILLFNPPPLAKELVNGLTAFVNNGGGVWITAGDRGGWKTLGDLLPLESCDVVDTNETMRFVEESSIPVLKGFSWNTTSLDRVVTGPLRPGSSAVLELGRTRRPVLSLRSVGSGRVGFWGSSIDRDWTSFPARAAYPILVNEMIRWLSEKDNAKTSSTYFVGESIERAGLPDQPVSLIRPDGKKRSFVWSGGHWRCNETSLPGFYEIQGKADRFVAVNVRAEQEGNPARMTTSEFAKGLGSSPGQLLSSDQAHISNLLTVLRGWDLTPLVGKIILVLAGLETVLLILFRKRRS